MRVGEYCNREVVFVEQESSLVEAAQLMRKYHVGDLVVVDEHHGRRHPIGILTDRDIVIKLVAEGLALDSVTVGDVMSFELQVAREQDDLYETLQRMRVRGIRRMPVIDAEGVLIGLLTFDDLLELISEQLSQVVELVDNEQHNEQILRH